MLLTCPPSPPLPPPQRNHIIRRLDLATHRITTAAGCPGRIGHADGDARRALFRFPHRLAYDGAHKRLYIAEPGHLIRVLDIPTGSRGAHAGAALMSGSARRKHSRRVGAPRAARMGSELEGEEVGVGALEGFHLPWMRLLPADGPCACWKTEKRGSQLEPQVNSFISPPRDSLA